MKCCRWAHSAQPDCSGTPDSSACMLVCLAICVWRWGQGAAAAIPVGMHAYLSCARWLVQVLVPCYTEDLKIVAETVSAAVEADLPLNSTMTVRLQLDCRWEAAASHVQFRGALLAAVVIQGFLRVIELPDVMSCRCGCWMMARTLTSVPGWRAWQTIACATSPAASALQVSLWPALPSVQLQLDGAAAYMGDAAC